MRNQVAFLFWTLLAVPLPALAQAPLADPALLPYQGRLEKDGVGVSATVGLHASLFDADTGGSLLWEETLANVQVVGGQFSVMLGSATPLPAHLFDGRELYLEIQVQEPAPALPVTLQNRKRLLPVPMAARAYNGVPVGALQAYLGTSAPAGWLLCDGSVKNRADYPALFAVLGTRYNSGGETGSQFRLPNLSERYLIGGGGALDAAVVGQLNASHVHSAPRHIHGSSALGADIGFSWTSGEGNRLQLRTRTDRFTPTSYVGIGAFANSTSGANAVARIEVEGNTDQNAADDTGNAAPDNRPPSLHANFIVKY